MRIGELAGKCDVSAKTVRYYELIGIMSEPARTESGYRNYSHSDVERLRFIRDAQASGLSLNEIQSVLELKDAGARKDLAILTERADHLDHGECSDPNLCQVITSR